VAQMGAACAAKLSSVFAKEALTTNTDGVQRVYYHVATMTNVLLLLELSFKAGFSGCKVRRCPSPRPSRRQPSTLPSGLGAM
jgi:hypothetical protein